MEPSTSIPQIPKPSKDPPPLSVSPPMQPPLINPIPPTPGTSRVSTYDDSPPHLQSTTSLQPPPTLTDPLEPAEPPDSSSSPPPPPPRPNFQPFFTLIHDPESNTTSHPSKIHYLFADDDPSELLSPACIRALQPPPQAAAYLPPRPSESESSSTSSATFREQKQQQQLDADGKGGRVREERIVIIDINSTGDGIANATSLSPDWQIVSTSLENAPTWEGGETEEVGGLMLKIEGRGFDVEDEDEGLGLGLVGGQGEEELQALMEKFKKGMGVLRGVVERLDEAKLQEVQGIARAEGESGA